MWNKQPLQWKLCTTRVICSFYFWGSKQAFLLTRFLTPVLSFSPWCSILWVETQHHYVQCRANDPALYVVGEHCSLKHFTEEAAYCAMCSLHKGCMWEGGSLGTFVGDSCHSITGCACYRSACCTSVNRALKLICDFNDWIKIHFKFYKSGLGTWSASLFC